MQDSFITAVIAGLGGMLGWGFADFFAKKTIDKIDDLRTLFWSQVVGIAPLIVLFLLNPVIPTLHRFDLPFLIIFGVVSGLSYLLLYNGFGKGEVSLLSPIFASYAAVVVLLSALFFGEVIPFGRLLAIVIVFAGLLMISSDPRDIRRIFKTKASKVKGLPQVLSAMIAYSFWLIFLDKFINGKEWVFYLLVIRCIAALSLWVVAQKRHVSLVVKDRSLWIYLVLIGLFDVMAYAFVSYGFSHSSYVSIVAVLSATFSLPTILLARIFLKEKVTLFQAVSLGILIIGIILVVLQ